MYSDKQVLKTVEEVAQTEGLKAFENIVDKDGHKRFIEGDLELTEETGLTISYSKWSLSGSHLLIVLAGTFANGTAHTSSTPAKAKLPQWILDKIYPVFSQNIEYKLVSYYDTVLSLQTGSCYLQKALDNTYLGIYLGSITFTSEKSFRVQFDLLIDNE